MREYPVPTVDSAECRGKTAVVRWSVSGCKQWASRVSKGLLSEVEQNVETSGP